MKAYKIIKTIRYDGVKLTHLKNLSVSIDEMDNTETINNSDSDDFMIIILLNRLSKIPLTLSQFVPCDENGKPLEKPKRTDRRDWDYQNEEDKKEEAYHKAQQNVIFEGWEVVKGVQGNVYTNKNFFLYVNNRGFFITTVSSYDIHFFSGSMLIKTLSDLAAATIENPLKLK